MTTNVTIFAVDGPVVIYLQDGSTMSVDVQETKQFQLPEGQMCTISDTPPKQEPVEGEEHPPPGYVLADKMINFWQGMKDRWQAATGEPEATPL
jgi:hypothetical protein